MTFGIWILLHLNQFSLMLVVICVFETYSPTFHCMSKIFKRVFTHLFLLSQCNKISRIGQNWTSAFLTNIHLKPVYSITTSAMHHITQRQWQILFTSDIKVSNYMEFLLNCNNNTKKSVSHDSMSFVFVMIYKDIPVLSSLIRLQWLTD